MGAAVTDTWQTTLGTGVERVRRRGSERSAGFTLVEVMVATLILMIAIAGISSSMLSAMALNRVNDETGTANEAARRAMEELSGVPFGEVWDVYNATGKAGATVPFRGPNFAVAGLDPQTADVDGMCGRIEFPAVMVGATAELREDVLDPGLGMPRDLNANTIWPETVAILDYQVLPVRVWVEWRGASGNRSVRLETMLCPR